MKKQKKSNIYSCLSDSLILKNQNTINQIKSKWKKNLEIYNQIFNRFYKKTGIIQPANIILECIFGTKTLKKEIHDKLNLEDIAYFADKLNELKNLYNIK